MKKIILCFILILEITIFAEKATVNFNSGYYKGKNNLNLFLDEEFFILETFWGSGVNVKIRNLSGYLENKGKNTYYYESKNDWNDNICMVSIEIKDKNAIVKEKNCEDINFSGNYRFIRNLNSEDIEYLEFWK